MKKQSFRRLPRVVRRLIAVLLAVALVLTVWTYRAALTPANVKAWVQENLLGNVAGGGYPVSFSGNADAGNFSVDNDAPALVTDMMLIHLSAGGKTRTQQHGYTNPVLRRSGSRFLLLDLGGKNYRISTDGVHFGENTEYAYTLFGGAVASTGSYALVSTSAGYTSQVTVFDASGKTRFEWASQTDLISAVCFSADGKRVAAASFTTQSGRLRASVRIFALDQAEPLVVRTYDEFMPLDIAFLQDGTVLCIGDTAAVRLSPDGTTDQVYDYAGQVLSAYAMHPAAGAALALSASSDGRTGALIRLDGAFAAHTVTRFSQPIVDLDLTETQLLVLQSGTVTRWNAENAQDGTLTVGTDCTRVCADSKSGFFLLGAAEIRHCDGFSAEGGASS